MCASMGGRVAVLVSGSGTNLQALLDDPAIRPHVELVLSDRPAIRALERATAAGIETVVIEPGSDRGALSAAVADALTRRGIDVDRERRLHAGARLAGRRSVAGSVAQCPSGAAAVVPGHRTRWPTRWPRGSRSPASRSTWWMRASTPVPIVLQEAIEIRPDDDWDTLEARVHEVEHRLLPRAVRALLEDRLVIARSASSRSRRIREHEADPAGAAGCVRQDRHRRARRAPFASGTSSSSSSGGTAAALARGRRRRHAVADVTGFPEMLGGRVKTLHPAIHAGLLADHATTEHLAPARGAGHRAVRPGRGRTCTRSARRSRPARASRTAIEKIDIGGPAMVRAARRTSSRSRWS